MDLEPGLGNAVTAVNTGSVRVVLEPLERRIDVRNLLVERQVDEERDLARVEVGRDVGRMLGRCCVLASIVHGCRELGLRPGDARQQISSLRFQAPPRIHGDHGGENRVRGRTRLVPVVASEE